MDSNLVSEIAAEVVNQTIFQNSAFYLLVVALSFLGMIGASFVTEYSRTRGRQYATKADIESINEQLRESTAITEQIKTDIHHGALWERELTNLKRQRLEEYLSLVDTAKENTHLEMQNQLLYANNDIDQPNAKSRASMIRRLYFPELAAEHAQLLLAFGEFGNWIVEGLQYQLTKRQETGLAQIVPDAQHAARYSEFLQRFNEAELAIEAKAQEIAQDLNAPIAVA